MKPILKYSSILLVAVIMLLLLAVPALAIATTDTVQVRVTSVSPSISSPDTIVINNVWVYKNCLETGDQLYIIYYQIDYTVNPTEDIADLFIIRLMNGATEVGATVPYAYYDDGYDYGVASIYLDSSEALTWEGSYTMYIVGNPTADWSGSAPSEDETAFDWQGYSDIDTTQLAISGRVLSLAAALDSKWTEAEFDLVDVDSAAAGYLTENGVAYFKNVIYSLQTIAPYALAYRIVDIDYDRTDTTLYDYDQDYADSLQDDLAGTIFDVSDVNSMFHVSTGALIAFLYYGCILIMYVKTYPKLNSTKPFVAILPVFVLAGAFIGVPLLVTIIMAFVCFLMLGYAIFYRNAAT